MPRDVTGKQLERLVAALERVLDKTGATVEANSRRLRDQRTGQPREHDVLITFDHGHHQILTAIECKDRSRPVGVPVVEGFAKKCEDTGVEHKVIVSSTGFTGTARTKAAAYGILCMELFEVESFPWLRGGRIVGYERQFQPWHVTVMFNEPHPNELGVVLDATGVEVSGDMISQIAQNGVPKSDDPEAHVGKQVSVRIKIETPHWTMRDSAGQIWPIDRIRAESSFATLKTETTMQMHRYSGGGKEYSVASGEMPSKQFPGHIVMVNNEDETTSIHLVPSKDKRWGILREASDND